MIAGLKVTTPSRSVRAVRLGAVTAPGGVPTAYELFDEFVSTRGIRVGP